METRANYVLIGTFTLVTTVLLLLFALWASNFSAERNWREYMVVFTEPVTGLTEGGSVQYNGLAVGTVESLNLEDVAPHTIDPEAPLFNEGLGLDSIDALELSLAVGKRYGVQLRADGDDNRRIFASLRTLSAHVQANKTL